ncbi:hypothetical protein TRVA0_024S01024 [Trichomonascus vanleenenianus]|uniref:uncharacterized protein n=1 Tax=Trichomonascus vanleenenianus TaxID=2268995 RepID=UPI003ECB3A7D
MASFTYIFAIVLAGIASYLGVLQTSQLFNQCALLEDGFRWSVNVKDIQELDLQKACNLPATTSPESAALFCKELFAAKNCDEAVPLVESTLLSAAYLLESGIADVSKPDRSLQSFLRNTFHDLYQAEPLNGRTSRPHHTKVIAEQYMAFNASRIIPGFANDTYLLQAVLFNDGQLQLHATLQSWISTNHPGVKIVMRAVHDRSRGYKKEALIDEVQIAASTWVRYVNEHDATCYSSFLTSGKPLYFRIMPTLRPMTLSYEQLYCFCEEKRSFFMGLGKSIFD